MRRASGSNAKLIYKNNDRADINMTVFAVRLRDAERERTRARKTGDSRGEKEREEER